jgi:hypothetical protein
MDFKWAIEEMKKGNKVRRTNFKDFYLRIRDINSFYDAQIIANTGFEFPLKVDDFTATNWELYEEPFQKNINIINELLPRIGINPKNCYLKQ